MHPISAKYLTNPQPLAVTLTHSLSHSHKMHRMHLPMATKATQAKTVVAKYFDYVFMYNLLGFHHLYMIQSISILSIHSVVFRVGG